MKAILVIALAALLSACSHPSQIADHSKEGIALPSHAGKTDPDRYSKIILDTIVKGHSLKLVCDSVGGDLKFLVKLLVDGRADTLHAGMPGYRFWGTACRFDQGEYRCSSFQCIGTSYFLVSYWADFTGPDGRIFWHLCNIDHKVTLAAQGEASGSVPILIDEKKGKIISVGKLENKENRLEHFYRDVDVYDISNATRKTIRKSNNDGDVIHENNDTAFYRSLRY